MAIAFRSTSAGAASGTTALTLAAPSGIQAGDIVILCAGTISGGSVSIIVDGACGPWTAISGSPIDQGAGEKLYLWWGRYASGSTGTRIQAGSDHVVGRLLAFSGCVAGTANPIDGTETGTASSSTSFSFSTSFSTSIDNGMVCVCCSQGTDTNTSQFSSWANSNLTNVTELGDSATNLGGGGGFGFASGDLATAGAVGTWSATLATASEQAYIAFGLKVQVATTLTPSTLSMSLSSFASKIGLGVVPATLALASSLFAPTIRAGVALIPATAALVLEAFAPVMRSGIVAGLASLATSLFAPSVISGIMIPKLSLVISSFAPIIRRIAVPPTLALVLTTYAASLNVPISTMPPYRVVRYWKRIA